MDNNSLAEQCVYLMDEAWHYYVRYEGADGYDSFIDGKGRGYTDRTQAERAMQRFIAYAETTEDVCGWYYVDDERPTRSQEIEAGQLEMTL